MISPWNIIVSIKDSIIKNPNLVAGKWLAFKMMNVISFPEHCYVGINPLLNSIKSCIPELQNHLVTKALSFVEKALILKSSVSVLIPGDCFTIRSYFYTKCNTEFFSTVYMWETPRSAKIFSAFFR